MFRSFTLACAIAVSTLCLTADAHTNMAVPVVAFPEGFYNGNSPMGRIDGEKFTAASSIPSYQGVNKIAKVMEGYKTLRQMIEANVNLSTISGHTGNKECGLTVTTGAKQPIPDAVDFPWGHPGPCEVWCDNNRIFFNADCQGNNVGKVPIDKTKCAGVNLIQAMYVGVHVSNWEVYANCAPMEGGTKTDPTAVFNNDATGSGASGATTSGSTGNDASGSTNTTPDLTPATTPAAGSDYSDEGSASSSTTTAPASTTEAPASTTAAPASSTTAPSSTKTNCKRRLRE